jgi:hypothetical protein
MNALLEGIGATSRFNNDEVIDNTQKLNNQNFRLAFDDYNMESPYLAGVQPTQTYSFYSGCSIALDEEALASGRTTWLVKGHDTTESFDSNKNLPGVALPKGSVYALAAEQLAGGGKMFIGGTVYISDFEVKAQLDNSTQLQNSNYNIVMNILDSIKNQMPVTPISVVRSAQKGDVFAVEGIVTAGKTPSDNAFFDTLYIQDATGGINLFPVAGTDIAVGQKVKAVGTLDEYLGDKELRVIAYTVTDTSINPIEPTLMITKDAMNPQYGGMLVKIKGIVTKMDSQNIYVNDGSGEARAFVDGYIGDGSGDPSKAGKWDPMIQVGETVSIVGLASVDTGGPRLRIRNTAEIIRLDIVPPVITSNIVNNTSFEKLGTLEVKNTAEDVFTGVDTIVTMLDGAAIENIGVINLESLDFGLHKMIITAVDEAGNTETKEIDFTVTASVSTIEALINRLYENNTLATIAADSGEDQVLRNKGTYESLLATLKADNLKPFINYLEAQNGKAIREDAAKKLLEYAKWVQALNEQNGNSTKK